MNYQINEKITDVLKTFTPSDIKKFRKFLKSPYMNPYPKAFNLFNALISYQPDFEAEKMTRQEIFKRMKTAQMNKGEGKTGGTYNDSTMRDLLSKLKRLLEKYMAFSGFGNNEFDYMTKLREQLSLRKLHNYVESNISETEHSLSRFTVADSDYFYKKIRLGTEKFNNLVINKKLHSKRNLNASISSLNNSASNQMSMFILETIKQNDAIIKLTKRYDKAKESNIIPELLEPINLKKVIITLKKNNAELSHIFQVYYYLYMLFSSRKGEQYFHLYKESIIENSNKISADELHFLFGRLIDYCVNKCNEGRSEYFKELSNAYMVMLERKYYTNSSNKYISQDLFRNILQTAIRTSDIQWAENLIERYRKELHPEDRDNMYNYCYAYVYFEKGNPLKALEYILKIKQDYFTLKIDIKLLLLKIYFELGMYENIYNQLDSFKHFVSNHAQITSARRKKINDFIKYFARILKARLKDDKISAVFINKELLQKDDRQFYLWLINKAEEIKTAKHRSELKQ